MAKYKRLFLIQFLRSYVLTGMTRRTSCVYPPGTYQTPQFFWRGGDVYKEAEHLQGEYIQAKTDYIKAKKELDEVTKEYQAVSEQFDNKEGQAVALASALGGVSSATEENAKLQKEIARLSIEINEIEQKITEAKQRSNPTYIGQLEKERATTYVSVERMQHSCDQTDKEIEEMKRELYEILTSDKWREACQINAEHNIVLREQKKLKSDVNKAFEEQNYATKQTDGTIRVRTVDNPQLQALTGLISQRDDLQNKLFAATHDRCMAQIYRRVILSSKLDQIEQLNDVLKELNMDDDVIDVEALRQKHLPEGALSPIKRPSTAMSKREPKGNSQIKRPFSSTLSSRP